MVPTQSDRDATKSESEPGSEGAVDEPGTRRSGLSRTIVLAVIGFVLFASVVGFAVFRLRNVASTPAAPAGAASTGIPIGRTNAAVTVDIYEDLHCPECRSFTLQSAATLDTLINSGAAKVVYHPVAFLDRASSTAYSSRAASAAACASQTGAFRRYLTLLYANQPAQGGPGLSTDQLIQLGREAGAGPHFADCVSSGDYRFWVESVSEAASQAGVTSVPTVEVNGRRIENTKTALLQAVRAVR